MTAATKPPWEELHRHFEATDDAVAYDRLDAIEYELLKAGTIKPLIRGASEAHSWEVYWQTIADTYVARHGDPIPRKEPK